MIEEGKKVNVYDIEGNVIKEISLPSIFNTPIRKEIIARAVLAEETWEKQPKGNYRWAGMETSATYVGRKEAYRSLKNRGRAMRPREFYGGGIAGRVRVIPSSVKGRRAHPPKPEKKIKEKINKKEYLLALKSAIAATAKEELVKNRGHRININVPIIINTDGINGKNKTKTIYAFLNKICREELQRAKKKRGKERKYPKSALFIFSDKEKDLTKIASNLPGCDAVTVKNLMVKNLAPGTHI